MSGDVCYASVNSERPFLHPHYDCQGHTKSVANMNVEMTTDTNPLPVRFSCILMFDVNLTSFIQARERWVEILPDSGLRWQRISKSVQEVDEENIQSFKEDVDTLLVFVSCP